MHVGREGGEGEEGSLRTDVSYLLCASSKGNRRCLRVISYPDLTCACTILNVGDLSTRD